jgi:hypothetical protein
VFGGALVTKLLRRFFALRGRRSFGRHRASLVLPAKIPPGTDSNPNLLAPQPLPGRPGPERDAPPGPTPQTDSGHKSGTSCSGRLPR